MTLYLTYAVNAIRNTYQGAPKQFLMFWVALCFPDIAQPTGYRKERLGTRLLISVNLQRRCYSVMGIPIPKPQVKWTFPSLITLAIWVRVRVKITGDAHITGVLRMGMPISLWHRHFRNDNGNGAEKRSAIVSGIVPGDVPVSFFALTLFLIPEPQFPPPF